MTVVHLRAAGVGLVLDARGPGLPVIRHWGADLGTAGEGSVDGSAGGSVEGPVGGSAGGSVEGPVGGSTGGSVDGAVLDALAPPVPMGGTDVRTPLAILPEHAAGWPGRPGLAGHRDPSSERAPDTGWSPSFALRAVRRTGPGAVTVDASDDVAGLALRTEVELAEAGLLRIRHVLRNTAATAYRLDGLAVTLPVPAQASELLDFTGRWSRERSPQRHPFPAGAWVRESRHGRAGHDATIGLCAGTPGFGFRHGEVWAVHVAYSGNHVTYAERLPSGAAVLGGGELLLSGEVTLLPGGEYATPWLCAAYSPAGLDGISAAFHGWLRSRPSHPHAPRPVVLNTWEAVYFDHWPERLIELADVAAALGVERFVLDDGWFRGRRDDTAGLGDWYVDPEVWPDGLHPLVEHVRRLGMQFGLWVEPEMVNPDSDLYRAHPDWVLRAGGRDPVPSRNQQVLDLANPDAYDYLLERLDALLAEYPIGYLKWDHNRDLSDAGRPDGPSVRRQTLAVYRLLDEVRARHPGVEIESCAGGGGRVDLGILQRTDRVWTSDCNDALERQAIQRWTGVFLPPELLGAHVGPPRSHTTGRVHELAFRTATALFGHAGIEWDVASVDAPREALAQWVRYYKLVRSLLHTGVVVRSDHPDPAAWLHGVVAGDRSEAVFAYVQLATSAAETPAPARLPGLDPDRRYRIEPVYAAGTPLGAQRQGPGWADPGGVAVPGMVLGAVGLPMPVLFPEQALVLHLVAT